MPSLAEQIEFAASCDDLMMQAIHSTLLAHQKHDPKWQKKRQDLVYADWKRNFGTNKAIGERFGITSARVGQIVQKQHALAERKRVNQGLPCLGCGSLLLQDAKVPLRYYDVFSCACGQLQKLDGRSLEFRQLTEKELDSRRKEEAEASAEAERARRLDEEWPCPGCGKMSTVGSDLTSYSRSSAVSGYGLPPWLFCSTCGYMQVLDKEIVRHEPSEGERSMALAHPGVQKFLATLSGESGKGNYA